MGGSKESPRQKLIGLMYLVLMALLGSSVKVVGFENLSINFRQSKKEKVSISDTSKLQSKPFYF